MSRETGPFRENGYAVILISAVKAVFFRMLCEEEEEHGKTSNTFFAPCLSTDLLGSTLETTKATSRLKFPLNAAGLLLFRA